MKKKIKDEIKIDILLQQTLRDDMPDADEKKLHTFIYDFNQKLASGEIRSHRSLYGIFRDLFLRLRFDWLRWAFRKEFAFMAALIMILAGTYLHTSGSESTLTNKIFLFGTSLLRGI